MSLRSYIDDNQIQEVPYTSEFENSTDYFDNVFEHPSIDQGANVFYFVDQHGRYAVLFKTNNEQGIVVHERYSGDEDLIVLTQSEGFSYNHSAIALERFLNIPFTTVVEALSKGQDSISFKKLLDEECFFDN